MTWTIEMPDLYLTQSQFKTLINKWRAYVSLSTKLGIGYREDPDILALPDIRPVAKLFYLEITTEYDSKAIEYPWLATITIDNCLVRSIHKTNPLLEK